MRRLGLVFAAAGRSSDQLRQRSPRPRRWAPHALLVEAETGSILFEKQADDWWRRQALPS
jgi:D-alanyl-D-alanine carboxypeptidase